MNEDESTSISGILEVSNLTTSTIRFWNDLQRRFSGEGLTVIEYAPGIKEEKFWRAYVGDKDKALKLDFKLWGKKEKDVYNALNEDLKKCFTMPGFRANQSFWNGFENDLNWRGFFMPVEELERLEKNQLQNHLLLLKMAQKIFPHIPFLMALKEESLRAEDLEMPLPIMALWHHFRCYVDFLKDISTTEPNGFRAVKNLFTENFAIAGFEQKLPSKQLVELLYLCCQQFYLGNKIAPTTDLNARVVSTSRYQKLLKRSAPTVQAFFEKHQEKIQQLINQGFKTTKKNARKVLADNIKVDFFEVCMGDLNLILIQELIDNQSDAGFLDDFPEPFQYKFGENRQQSIGDKMKSIIGNASIMDRIQAVADKVQSNKLSPLFAPPAPVFSNKRAQQWYEISDEEKTELLQAIAVHLPEYQVEQLNEIAKIRWNKHLKKLANKVTAPFFIWEIHQSKLIPQVNLLENEKASALQQEFWTKREKEAKELMRLEKLLPQLYEVKSFVELRRFKTGFKDFSFAFVQEQWSKALDAHEITIQNRSNYRMRRMQEFGILETGETLNFRKEIWLDEMLQIEEEVRPYILFVKKAFQSALPVRRSVEFDPYRHSHDGVEFDPMTVQDQDKWVRAEVMKTLKNKVDRGEVEQINTFCLDSSGSMDHEPMRNLFKILYLLILGLEDRKSYDAIHFFSTFFIETANFTDNYTNRSLLFKVLRKISTITNDKVLYGGNGGTNISDGVLQCHTRIQDFVKGIEKKEEEVNIVSSLFVITDGEPSMGIINLEELSDFIETKRKDGNVAIKGIYIKPKEEVSDFIPQIFGANNYVETTDFNEAVNNFVNIMTATYKAQRKDFKWQKRKKKRK